MREEMQKQELKKSLKKENQMSMIIEENMTEELDEEDEQEKKILGDFLLNRLVSVSDINAP